MAFKSLNRSPFGPTTPPIAPAPQSANGHASLLEAKASVMPTLPLAKDGQPVLRRAGERLPPSLKGFRLGYPLGSVISARNDPSTEALLDYCYRVGLGCYEWCQHMRLLGSVRAQSVRIDDNRNLLCKMHLEKSEEDGAEVLVMLDRDELYPPDGVVQLALTCTAQLPVVCGVYFQRMADDPYPHVYRFGKQGVNRWNEPSKQSDKLVREIWDFIQKANIPEAYWAHETSVRFAHPDGQPLPEDVRLLIDPWGDERCAFGGTGFVAIHNTLLRDMERRGAPYYPWFRDRGEKGDMAFFLKAQELGYKTAVDLSVYAGHLSEDVVGLPHFMKVFGPACALADAHVKPQKIDQVAVVIPTLDPKVGARLLAEVQRTAGMDVLGVIVADYARRGGTKTLNDGIAAALSTGAPAVLLLDDDVSFPTPGWLRRLADALQDANVGAVGPSLPCRGPQAQEPPSAAIANDMPFLCGAVMLYKRQALMDVGALDERMRHYASDTDHGLLLRNHGWRLVWVPEVHVEHAIAANGFFPEQWQADHAVLEEKWANVQGSQIGPGLPQPREPDGPPAPDDAALTRRFVAAGV